MKLKIENFDWLTFLPALIISFMSIALIYSAKHASVSGVERMLFVKQGIWVVLGLIAFYLTYRLPVRTHERQVASWHVADIAIRGAHPAPVCPRSDEPLRRTIAGVVGGP